MRTNINRRKIALAAILVLGVLLTGCTQKRQLKEYTVTATEQENEYDFIYDELKHRIVVCAPECIDDNTAIIVMLHGYGGTATAFRRDTQMDVVANPRNYMVVYVTGAADKNDPTSAYGWNSSWNSRLRESEKDDVGMLSALVKYLQKEYGLKSDKAFVAGFSNGGFMTFRLAVEADDVFSACASVGGKMTEGMWQHCSDKHNKTAGFLQINGTADDVVPMNLNGTVDRANDPAIEDVIAYLAEVNHCQNVETATLSDKSELIRYYGKSKKQIWEVIIDEGRHSWPDETFAGFDANELILDFFDLYR